MNKVQVPILVVSLLVVATTWIPAQVHDLQLASSADGIELRWVADAVNGSSPYHFPTVQIQMSHGLETWEDVGEPIAAPNSSKDASLSDSANIVVPEGDNSVFVRLRSFFDGSGKSYVGADFSGADLRGARFEGTDLTDAVFDYAVVAGARFTDTNLAGSSWEGALIEGAEFTNVSLEGLDFFRNAIGSPDVTRLAGDGDAKLSGTLPSLRHFARGIDFPGGYGGLEKFRVSYNTALCLLSPEMTVGELNDLLVAQNCTVIGSVPSTTSRPHFVTLRTPTETHEQLARLLDTLKATPDVLHAAWDCMVDSFSIPSKTDANDWEWDKQSGGNWGWHQIKAPQMWNLNEAVEKELEKSGKKPPQTGLVDRDTFAAHPDFFDARHTTSYFGGNSIGHGTHVGGIIGAAHNGSYVDGVNPFTRLYVTNVPHLSDFRPLWNDRSEAALGKYSRQIFEDYVDHVGAWVTGLAWLIEDEASSPVINVSEGLRIDEIAGGVSLAELEKIVAPIISSQAPIIRNLRPDSLLISAAGNASESVQDDTGMPVQVPAALASPLNWAALVEGVSNIVVVESMGRDGERLPSSNIGGHVMAPGEEILSLGENGTEYRSGSSQAAAFVSGVASYLTAVDPDLDIDGLFQIIRDTGDDGWASVMDIDGLGAGHRVLKMLCDIDDGSEDGNTRIDVDPGSAKSDRNFKHVTDGDENQDEDMDDDGGPGDGVIDISDFRRWRDALLYIEGNEKLNGLRKHAKHDLNRDGSSDGPKNEEVYPRADFNGDGKLDRDSTSPMTGVHEARHLTDLEVLTKAPAVFWEDEHYELSNLADLIDSVDLHISAGNFFSKNKELGVLEMEIGVYDKGEDVPLYGKRKLSLEDSTEIITVPVGGEYEVRSELIDGTDNRMIQLVSPGSYHVTESQRGADLSIDLVPHEQTVRTTLLSRNVELLDSDPIGERVESAIDATNGLATGKRPQGGAAFANDQMTFDGGVITGILEEFAGGPGADTMVSEVILHRSFIKQADVPDPNFRVSPTTLRIVDGAIAEDKRALVDLRLEKRVGLSEWDTVFYTRTEIAGQVFNDGSHNFRITDHQGDRPKEELTILKTEYQGSTTYHGAEYISNQPYTGEVSLGDIEAGETFELRYSLTAEGFSGLADEVAEAYIGDPLEYGEPSVTMEYGSFGELFSVQDVESLPEGGGAKVTHRSRADYYFVLERIRDGKETAVAFGKDELGAMVDESAAPGAEKSDYHVRGIRLDRPEDQDDDGIDDVYELRRPDILDPLDASDALKDSDGDGFNNLTEYEHETDPQVFDEGGNTPNGGDYVFPGTPLPLQGSDLYSVDLNGDGRLDFVSRVSIGSRNSHIEAILASPDVYFQSPISSAVSDSELDDLVVGNVDGDEFPDAVVLDQSGRTVTAYLGNGDGSFTKGASYDTGEIPTTLIFDDTAGSESVQLFVVLERAKQIMLLSTNDNGEFEESGPPITVDSNPIDVAVGYNETAAPIYLAVTHRQFIGEGKVSVFPWAGGVFGDPKTIDLGATPGGLATGDLNGDGDEDIVTVNANGRDLTILLRTGPGEFAPRKVYETDSPGSGILVRDVTGDGNLDLVVSHGSASFSSLFSGDGAGDFDEASPIYTKASEEDPIAGDWNGDGFIDLAIGTLVVNGTGDGNFDTRQQIDIPDGRIREVLAGDVDGDGAREVVALSSDAPFFEIWEPELGGQPKKIARVQVSAEPVAMVLIDVNGDGREEVAVASKQPQFLTGSDQVSIFAGNTEAYALIAEVSLDENPSALIAAELNGDAARDLLVTFGNKVVPLINDRTGQFAAEPAIALADIVSQVTARDLDEDGIDEIILAGFSIFNGSALHVLRRGGGTYSEDQTLAFPGASQKLLWVDANGDGRDELISHGSEPGNSITLRQFEVENGKLLPPVDWLEVERGFLSQGDVNSDGKPDLLIDGTTLYLSNADENFAYQRAEIYAGGARTRIFTDGFESGDLRIISWDWFGGFVGLVRPKESP